MDVKQTYPGASTARRWLDSMQTQQCRSVFTTLKVGSRGESALTQSEYKTKTKISDCMKLDNSSKKELVKISEHIDF